MLRPDNPRPAVSPVLLTALFVVTLGGRFAMASSQTGVVLGLDLRAGLCVALLLAALTWWMVADQPVPLVLRPVAGVLLLLAYLLLGGFWADPAARLSQVGLDLAMLVVLVLVTAIVVAADPSRALYWFFLLSVVAAVVFAVAAWLTGPGGQGRYAAFGGGPNVFVRIQCLGVIAAVALAIRGHQLWYLAPVPLLLYSAFLSGSRGGLAALIVAAAVAVVLGRGLRFAHALGMLLLAGILAVVAYVFGNSAMTELYSRYSFSGLQSSDFSVRPELLRRAWRIMQESPWFGAGMDGFFAHSGRFLGIDYPHNMVAEIGADGGLVGLLLLVGAVGWLLRSTVRGGRWASWDRGGCLVAGAYLATAGMFSGTFYDARLLWIYLTMLGALATRPAAPPAATTRTATAAPPATAALGTD